MQLAEYPVIYEQTVAWGDMDAFGHVNNVIYYRYMESARLAYMEHIDLFSYGISPVVRSNQCEYLQPVYYPDQLKIGVKVIEIGNTSFKMQYVLWSQQQNTMVARGESVLVCIHHETKVKMSIPVPLKDKINSVENRQSN